MFESFKRSWEITKTSVNVLMLDKELLLFPIFAGFFSLIFFMAMVFPFLVSEIVNSIVGETLGAILSYVAVFVLYLGLAFIATFFNVCVVYTIKKRFEGKNANFFESLGFGVSKIHLIFLWSIVSATVGLILNILDNLAEKLGPIGNIVMNLMVSILGGVWGIVTIFVVPSMVYDNVGPLTAIKNSIEVLKKTWGESLIRYVGLGVVQMMLFFVVLFVGIIFSIVLLFVMPILGVITFLVTILLLILVMLIFSLLNTVFNTALFVYAKTGVVPQGYNSELIKSAFKRNEQKKGLF